MIEKTLKTIDGKLRVKIPTVLNEVTLGQMIEMQEKPNLNDLEAISILSGLPIEKLQNVCSIDDFAVFEDYILSLSHQIKYLYNSDAIPAKVNFDSGKLSVKVNVIRNLSVEPAGAFMAAREIIADEINEHIKQFGEDNWRANFNPSLKACCQVLAHYFFCRVTNKRYNEYEVEEFNNEIKKLRVTISSRARCRQMHCSATRLVNTKIQLTSMLRYRSAKISSMRLCHLPIMKEQERSKSRVY